MGSSAVKLKHFAQEQALFVRSGVVGFLVLVLIGAMAFVFDPVAVARLINLVASGISAFAVRRNERTREREGGGGHRSFFWRN